jgi:hypothetical protein
MTEALEFCTPEERYVFLSSDLGMSSFLVCAKFVNGSDQVSQEPIYGTPVLTVIQVTAVTLHGQSMLGEDVWPDATFLSPAGWRVPDGTLYPFAGSVAPITHDFFV